jgi:hypothetical protein
MTLTPKQIGEMLGQQLVLLWEQSQTGDLDTIPTFTEIDVTTQGRILDEVQYLRMFAMDYGVTIAMGGMTAIRNQILDGFLDCIERDEIGSYRVNNVTLNIYNSRAIAYAQAVRLIRPGDRTSLIKVGGMFCQQCGLTKRVDIASWAVLQFVSTQKLAREMMQTLLK